MKTLTLITTVLLMSFSAVSFGIERASQQSTQQAQQVLLELQTWKNKDLKSLLAYRMTENKYMLDFINEYHAQLGETELDKAYEYFAKSLIEDQNSLAFIFEQLANVSTSEELNLDQFLASKARLKSEVEFLLGNNIQLASGKGLVNRVLYYGLMDKYKVTDI